MGEEGESAEQAAAARRERLRALRAAKELLNTPDEENAAAATRAPDSGNDVAVEDGRETAHEEPNGKRKDSNEDAATDVAPEQLNSVKYDKELPGSPDETSDHEVSVEDSEDLDEEKMNVKFRNYVPLDKNLQEHKLAPPSLPKFEDPVAPPTEPETTEDPFLNIAPKKPNWDLRRDVQKKLEKLEKRTQKALYELYVEQEERQASEGTEEMNPEN